MNYKPLRGRLIVTRDVPSMYGVLHLPNHTPERGLRTADKGTVLASGLPPEGAEPIPEGATVYYHGPAEKLAIEWQGVEAYAVHWDEVLAVVDM